MENTGCCYEWMPVMAMLAVDLIFGAMNILIKKSLDEGMNCLVLITLRQLTATIFLAPVAYFWERKSRPKLSGRIIAYIFFSALLGGSLTQYLFFIGLQYTSATFACAFLNLTPVFTFLVALPFRMETLDLRRTAGKAKMAATLVCLGGTVLLMFYRGMALTYTAEAQAEANLLHHAASRLRNAKALRWTMGSISLFAGCISWSSWFLVQSKVTKSYPAIYSSTALLFFLSSLQAASLTFITQRDVSVWLLKGKLQVITVLFAGVVGSGIGTVTMTWCVSKRGPVFTAAFSPLIQIVVAVVDFSLLKEPLYLGSVLGSVLVIFGLYVLLWAKNKEVQTHQISSAPTKAVESNSEGDCRSNGQVEQV